MKFEATIFIAAFIGALGYVIYDNDQEQYQDDLAYSMHESLRQCALNFILESGYYADEFNYQFELLDAKTPGTYPLEINITAKLAVNNKTLRTICVADEWNPYLLTTENNNKDVVYGE